MPPDPIVPVTYRERDGSASDNGGDDAGYERLSRTDRAFLKGLNNEPPLGHLPVEEERRRMRAGQASEFKDFEVSTSLYETPACRVLIVRPRMAEGILPITFYLHGGGWVLGDVTTHTRLISELAIRSGSAVGFVQYPLAPENPFPNALESCLAAMSDVVDHAKSLGLDAERFALAGDSSGGNLTAACILLAQKRGMPLPLLQVLLYPVLEHEPVTSSYQEYGDNPNLSWQTMKWFWNSYLQGQPESANPLVSPLRASETEFAAFPATLIVTCEYDVLRDEGEDLAARLVHAGVDVTAVRWLGALHGFLVTELLAQSASADACIGLVAEYLKKGFAAEERRLCSQSIMS